jgi:small ligand-binding sensory domain FIST
MVGICLGGLLFPIVGFGFAMYGFAQSAKRRQAGIVLAITIVGWFTIGCLFMLAAG